MESRVQTVERNLFHHRIRKLNENHENREVWYSIDRPMRPLVFELSRIGMITEFCCCGFSYDDEEEPKTHMSNHAYVFFFAPENAVDNFKIIHKHFAKNNGIGNWRLYKPFSDKPIWSIRTEVSKGMQNIYQKSDGISEAIHDYESYAVGIHSLTGWIQSNLPTFCDPVIIRDGNSNFEHIEEWQVRPKKEFKIGVDEYYEQFGKLENRPTWPNMRLISDVVTQANKILEE